MTSSKKRILVTGASGFVGANLTRNLIKSNFEVYAFIRPNSQNLWRLQEIINDVRVYYVDLTEKATVDKLINKIKPEVIFHLAAYGGHPKQNDLRKIIDTNLLGTINLIESSLKNGFESFVNAGTSSEYGRTSTPMNEDMRLDPFTSYGAAKAATSIILNQLAKEHDCPIATLRLFSVYGPYENPLRLIPTLMLASISKDTANLASKKNIRDLVYVDDVVKALTLCSRKKTSGIFNIGSGKQHTVAEVVSILKRITRNKLLVQWGKEKSRPYELKVWQADIKLAKKHLGWQPNKTLNSGLKKTYEWFCENHHLYKNS